MIVKSIIASLIKVGCDYALKRLASKGQKSLNVSKKRNSESSKVDSKIQDDEKDKIESAE